MKKIAEKIRIACLAACLLIAGSKVQAQATAGLSMRPPVSLKVGDNAPPVVAAKWFKGEPVTTFKPGQVYVIEFWATWCGPCRAAMPHLSELAKQYKGKVTVIGFDVQELIAGSDKNGDYITKVNNFVKNLGDGMNYTVAADVREGTMWNTWMKAAGLGGIPSSFVIDQQGKIAWIGHPMGLEDVLPLVVDGTFDEVAKQKVATERKEKNKILTGLRLKLDTLKQSGDKAKALELAQQLIDISIFGKSAYIVTKYELLKGMDASKAAAYLTTIKKDYENDPLTLQAFASALAKQGSSDERATAVKIMEQAVGRCAPDDPYAYIALAEVYAQNGDVKKAVAAQEKVVAILSDTSLVRQKQEVIDKAKESLEKYKATL
jgi:thiol-disulfide isomerase/thioredoxin/predicted Zn-dependent protease